MMETQQLVSGTVSDVTFTFFEFDADKPIRDYFSNVNYRPKNIYLIRAEGIEIPVDWDETPRQALLRWAREQEGEE